MTSRALIGGLALVLLMPVAALAADKAADGPAPAPAAKPQDLSEMDAPYQKLLKTLDNEQVRRLAELDKKNVALVQTNISIMEKGAKLESCHAQGFLKLDEYGPKFVKVQDHAHSGQSKEAEELVTKEAMTISYVTPDVMQGHLIFTRVEAIRAAADRIKADIEAKPATKEDCDKAKADIDATIKKNKL